MLSGQSVFNPWQAIAAGSTAGAAAAATTLTPLADATVQDGSGLTVYKNYGNTVDLLVKGSSRGDAESYLKFDLRGLGGTVTSAQLVLTPLAEGAAADAGTFRVGLLSDGNDGWIEGSGQTNFSRSGPITWANAPYYSGSTVTVSGAQFQALQPITIDVTRLVNQRSNTNGIASFYIDTLSGNAQCWVDFASRENGIAGYRPMLIINGGGSNNQAPTITGVTGPGTVSGTTAALFAAATDDGGAANLSYLWTETAGPAGVQFSANGTAAAGNTTVTFQKAGTYTFNVKVTDAGGLATNGSVTVVVTPTLTKLAITPAAATVVLNSTQQYTAGGLDQFNSAIATPLAGNVWSSTIGAMNAATGVLAANALGSGTVTVTNGALSASTSVSIVQANPLGLKDAALANYVQTAGLYSDGSISRQDWLGIFQQVEGDLTSGTVTANEFADLKTILTWTMPGYVQVLAGDIINGSVANAQYQGAALGNLVAGSSAAQLSKLVGKWFLGADHPTATANGSYAYKSFAGNPLFSNSGPNYTDEDQGNLGDCYLISALGSVARVAPSTIANMFIVNGDGTYTVRFFYNGKADYVTVDALLPAAGSLPAYEGLGAGGSLWLALAEKAYAQWNETGREGRNGTNSYAAIEGGWMSDVYRQMGLASQDYSLSSTAQSALIAALTTSGYAATIGTVTNPGNGLYGNHAYAVVGYNSTSGTFLLYNPWGSNQPGWLTWSQLVASCDGISIATIGGASAVSYAALPSNARPTLIAADTGRTAAATDAAFAQLGGVPQTAPAAAAESATGETRSIIDPVRPAVAPATTWTSLRLFSYALSPSNGSAGDESPCVAVDAVLSADGLI